MSIRKLSAILLSGMLLTCTAALPASASRLEGNGAASNGKNGETYDDGMFTFAYVDGGVELCGVDTSALAVRLPDETDGRRIVGIADGAFYGCTSLESVQFGKYVSYIGESAFAGCESLHSVTIPDSVERIGKNAFSGCIYLESLTLPEGLTVIPDGLCYYCVSLPEITIPEGVTSIGAESFYYCLTLSAPVLPDGVQKVGDYAFAFCSSFETVELPSSVTSLGSAVYFGCEALTEFTVPADLTMLGTLCFTGCSSLASYAVEEGNTVYTAEDGVLFKENGSVLFAYPAGRTDTEFTVPDGVTTIFDAAFFTASNLTAVHFPAGLQYIGAGAFEYCTSLRSVVIPEGVEIIYENAFADCTSLQSVSLPQSLKGIGGYAFYTCPALKEITVPSSCKTIGEYAFGYMDGTETDENGNFIPVMVEGFKKRSSGFPIMTVIWWVLGAAVLALVIFLLVRTVRENQMTDEEAETIKDAKEKAEDASYQSIADTEEDDEE